MPTAGPATGTGGPPRRPTLPLVIALVLALALGATQTTAFVRTATLWWLPIVAAAGLLLLWQRAGRPLRAAAIGLAYGTGWLVAGVWWLFVSMHRYGGLHAALAALAVLALSLALSLYLAAAGWAFARWRRGTPWADALLFAALWLLAELARGTVFTGFPWLASGYSQVDAPLAALAPWVGVYGIGFALALTAALLAAAIATRGRAWTGVAAAAGGLALLAVLGPGTHTKPAGTIGVTLLQPAVPQDEKFVLTRLPETLAWVGRGLVEATSELVIAPETAVPLLPDQLADVAPGYWDGLVRHFAAPGRAALVGVPLGDHDRGYTNSVAGLSARGLYRYDKHHLVPFGEFIPRGFRWFTELMNIPLGDFARGPLDAPPFLVGTQRVAPNICYEDLFGEELAVRFADRARAPTMFANLSNIGWFGDTIAVPQHLAISRLRSLEFERAMLRATNTGATALVDHRGRVVASLPAFERGVLEVTAEGRSGLTPYARWASRVGHLPLWALGLGIIAIVVIVAIAGRRRG